METAVVSSKFQVVIPKSVREKMGIEEGQLLGFEPMKKGLRVVVVPSLKELDGKFLELRNSPSREELWRDENR